MGAEWGAQATLNTNPTLWPKPGFIYRLEPKTVGDLDDPEVKLQRVVAEK